MTTINAAAAWRFKSPVTLACLMSVVGLALAGCETSASLLGTSNDASSTTTLAQPAAQPAASGAARVAIAPVIGAPDAIAKQLQASLGTALQGKQIAVANSAADKPQYTLRGYVVSAREQAKTKVSYIWDVTDPTGKRVNRITGEELLPAGKSNDPWSSVNAQVVNKIAGKTAGSLASWLPAQRPTTQSNVAAGAKPNPANTSGQRPAQQNAAAAAVKKTAATGPTTGSITNGKFNAVVPSVTGAPGDGSVALRNALQKELARNGVNMAQQVSTNTYRVEGEVKVGQGKAGKQPIQIDWHVKDPAGKKLGTVSQKNEIPQGSLDGPWGKTADAAAAAAAQGILKLLPN